MARPAVSMVMAIDLKSRECVEILNILLLSLWGQGFGTRCLPREDSLSDFVRPIHYLNCAAVGGFVSRTRKTTGRQLRPQILLLMIAH
jgi:hypothetical protein